MEASRIIVLVDNFVYNHFSAVGNSYFCSRYNPVSLLHNPDMDKNSIHIKTLKISLAKLKSHFSKKNAANSDPVFFLNTLEPRAEIIIDF